MPLPEVIMSDSFRGATGVAPTPHPPVRAAGETTGDPAESSSRGRTRMFWGLGLAWLVASATVAAQLLQAGAPHRSAVARTSDVPFSVR